MATIQEILKQYWGYDQFRPMQEDIITAVLDGHDTLALLPTGGGKSICYQVPALLQPGICVVISPLIALMKDQVENLNKRDIKAVAIYSGMNKYEIDICLDNCIYGQVKFLYLSPERLGSDLVKERLQKMKISLLAIDEAHCISQWGYDFRPAYLKIAEIRELLPDVPILALTASATPPVQLDIQEKLLFKNQKLFCQSFTRKNLAYVVQYKDDKAAQLLRIAQNVKGSGLVYVRSRRKTIEIAQFLQRNQIIADFYHAGISPTERSTKQDRWINNQCRIMVATNAFGMGIDKPDVKFVVHMDVPDSLEAYYQEAGRAGRNGEKAFGVLLYNETDKLEAERRLVQSFPEPADIKRTYQAICNYYQLAEGAGALTSFDFDLSAFCKTYTLDPNTVHASIEILQLEGLITASDAVFQPSKVFINVGHDQLYDFQIKNPQYDSFIKMLLRSYDGLLTEFRGIKETELAARLCITKDIVIKTLQLLHQKEILIYQPQSDSPQLTFNEARMDVRHLNISAESLQQRKERFMTRMDAMLHYATSTDTCRSQLLSAYFGEKDVQKCGICDVCLSAHEETPDEEVVEQLSDAMVKLLMEHTQLSLDDLVKTLHYSNSKHALYTVQWLLDNAIIEYGPNRMLVLI